MNTLTYAQLNEILRKPSPFERYTTPDFWNEPHVSRFLLQEHLNPGSDLASRNHAFIDRSVDWIIEEFEITERSGILDLGCGPGMYTSRLARTKANITGIDVSSRSISYAQEQASRHNDRIRYLNENYLEFQFDETYDLVIMIFCDFCVLSPAQRRQLLRKIHRSLRAGGMFLFDVSSLRYYEGVAEKLELEFHENGGFWSPEGHYVFNQTFKYETEKLLLDKYSIVTGRGQKQVFNHLQCYSLDTIVSELFDNEFEVEKPFSNAAGDEFSEDSEEYALIVKPRR